MSDDDDCVDCGPWSAKDRNGDFVLFDFHPDDVAAFRCYFYVEDAIDPDARYNSLDALAFMFFVARKDVIV